MRQQCPGQCSVARRGIIVQRGTTTMYTLFGSRGSGSAAVEAALELTGSAYRIVDAATWEPDSALEELRLANPLQQIPTLCLPDGTVLTESAAILAHLGWVHPESGLLPTEASQRGQVLRGLVFIAANCYACIGIIDYPERWCDGAPQAVTEALKQGARKRLHHCWSLFADEFAGRPWLSGESLGALDLMAVVVSKWSGARAHLQAAKPEFHSLLLRIEQHERLAPVLARHWPT
jgi:GST-like protein